MKDKKVIFMGTPEFSVPVLEKLMKLCSVVGVVTQPDKEVGRHKEKKASPVKEVALKYEIPVFQPEKIRTDYASILNLQPDLIVTCAYGQIIPKEILDAPKYGCINVHASLLPRWRGGAPMQRAIMAGDKKTGVTIMYMDEHMDTGDMILQKEISISDTMTLGELHDALSILGSNLLEEVLPSIFNQTNQRVKQNEELVTYAKIIKKEDEILDFSKTAEEIRNQVRALNPFPGATTFLDGKIIKVYEVSKKCYDQKCAYGTVTSILKDGIGVAVADGEIILKVIKPEGKKQISVKDYLNGVKKEELLKKRFGEV